MKKRADIGIGTLIVFIAMILAAAVAAGVIIRTSGILQERALAVGGESRQRLVTGIEVLQVLGISNVEENTIPYIEIFIRTRSGSGPVQLRTLGLIYSTKNAAFTAQLQHPDTELFNENLDELERFNILNSSWLVLPFDMNRDLLTDEIRYVNNSDDEGVLEFKLSGFSEIIEIPLNVTFSGTETRTVSLKEKPVIYDEVPYGFVSIEGEILTDGYLNLSNVSLNIRQFPSVNVCTFDILIPEQFFCYESRIGDASTVLLTGELYVIKYSLTSKNELTEEDVFQFTFMPKDGSTTFLESSAPPVIADTRLTLWPS
ncbi:MAG: archaellin/type IV pilin N-terminal domain-containing protein [Candidatus Woesearchaeota archaeon]